MKHTPVKYELVQLINDPLDSNSGYHTKKDYYRIFTGGQNYYDFSTGEGFNITGYISEQNVKLLASSPALESQVKELREAAAKVVHSFNEAIRVNGEACLTGAMIKSIQKTEQLLNKQP